MGIVFVNSTPVCVQQNWAAEYKATNKDASQNTRWSLPCTFSHGLG